MNLKHILIGSLFLVSSFVCQSVSNAAHFDEEGNLVVSVRTLKKAFEEGELTLEDKTRYTVMETYFQMTPDKWAEHFEKGLEAIITGKMTINGAYQTFYHTCNIEGRAVPVIHFLFITLGKAAKEPVKYNPSKHSGLYVE